MYTRWIAFSAVAVTVAFLLGGCATATSAAKDIVSSALNPLQISTGAKQSNDPEAVAKQMSRNAKAAYKKKEAEYEEWVEAQKRTIEQMQMESDYNKKGIKTNFNKRPLLESFEQYQESRETKKREHRSTRPRRNPRLRQEYR